MTPLAAQASRVTGRLLRVGPADTVPITGTVVLHRLSPQAQGPIDTIAVGPDGRFSARVPVDTASLYLLSARHAGIEYFGRPLRTLPGFVDTLSILVHDTSATAPVTLGERYLLVSRATAPQGQAPSRRSVLDLLVIRNRSALTRAAHDSTAPTWTFPLIAGAADLLAGEGEFSAAAFDQHGDTLRYLAPVLPGDRQLVVRYSVAAERTLDFPTLPSADSVVVLLEEPDARVETEGFARGDSTVIEGKTYYRWVGKGPLESVRLAFAGGGSGGRDPLPWLVGVLGLLLAAGVAIALRRRPAAAPAAPAPQSDDVNALVEAIARLDAAYGGQDAELDEATRARYADERARLRARLDRALASKGAGR